jgi:hypothetical protein
MAEIPATAFDFFEERIVAAKYADLGERLIWNSVLSPDSSYNGSACWVWIGKVQRNRRGVAYPVLTLRYKSGPRKGKVYNARAHRKALEFFKGRRMTPRSVGMHLCNNSLCVNPEHLAGGSQKKNVQQCVADGRHYSPT